MSICIKNKVIEISKVIENITVITGIFHNYSTLYILSRMRQHHHMIAVASSVSENQKALSLPDRSLKGSTDFTKLLLYCLCHHQSTCQVESPIRLGAWLTARRRAPLLMDM